MPNYIAPLPKPAAAVFASVGLAAPDFFTPVFCDSCDLPFDLGECLPYTGGDALGIGKAAPLGNCPNCANGDSVYAATASPDGDAIYTPPAYPDPAAAGRLAVAVDSAVAPGLAAARDTLAAAIYAESASDEARALAVKNSIAANRATEFARAAIAALESAR